MQFKKYVATLMTALMLCLLAAPLSIQPGQCSSYGEMTIKPSTKATYVASSGLATPAAATTDIFQLYGSATKTVRVQRIEAVYHATAFGADPSPMLLLRRSTANTGGTSTTITPVSMDSANAATTATACKLYTANPTTGTLAGQLKRLNINCMLPGNGTAPPHSGPAVQVIYEASPTVQPIVLRGTAEGVVINFNGVIPQATTPQLGFNIYYTEE